MPANQQLRRRNHLIWERLITTATDAELRTLHEIAETEMQYRGISSLSSSVDEPEDEGEHEERERGTGQHRIPEEGAPTRKGDTAPPQLRQRPTHTTGPGGERLVRRHQPDTGVRGVRNR